MIFDVVKIDFLKYINSSNIIYTFSEPRKYKDDRPKPAATDFYCGGARLIQEVGNQLESGEEYFS